MNKEFDLLVFIGRFSPLHLGHVKVIQTALEKSRNVLVLVGSAGKARTIRTPFTFQERENVISEVFSDHVGIPFGYSTETANSRLIIKPLYDKLYNDSAWVKQIQDIANNVTLDIINEGGFHLHGTADAKVGLIGASKDHSSYYLKLFPQWESVNVDVHGDIHATNIREGFLEGRLHKWEVQDSLLPKESAQFLFDRFIHTSEYDQLKSELVHVKAYKKSWAAAPYPVKHVTVDAVVEQSGHILLVKRRSEPGKGLWALPGGHLEMDERISDGILRELKEETLIKVPEKVIRGCQVGEHVFDDVHRSTLGRVITHAAHFKLTDDVKLPKVKGADDAEKAKWIPIGELREDMLFDDHFHIINFFLGV